MPSSTIIIRGEQCHPTTRHTISNYRWLTWLHTNSNGTWQQTSPNYICWHDLILLMRSAIPHLYTSHAIRALAGANKIQHCKVNQPWLKPANLFATVNRCSWTIPSGHPAMVPCQGTMAGNVLIVGVVPSRGRVPSPAHAPRRRTHSNHGPYGWGRWGTIVYFVWTWCLLFRCLG